MRIWFDKLSPSLQEDIVLIRGDYSENDWKDEWEDWEDWSNRMTAYPLYNEPPCPFIISTSLCTQQYDELHWFAYDLKHQLPVTVLDDGALTLLQRFTQPLSIFEALGCAGKGNALHVVRAVHYFTALNLLQQSSIVCNEALTPSTFHSSADTLRAEAQRLLLATQPVVL